MKARPYAHATHMLALLHATCGGHAEDTHADSCRAPTRCRTAARHGERQIHADGIDRIADTHVRRRWLAPSHTVRGVNARGDGRKLGRNPTVHSLVGQPSTTEKATQHSSIERCMPSQRLPFHRGSKHTCSASPALNSHHASTDATLYSSC